MRRGYRGRGQAKRNWLTELIHLAQESNLKGDSAGIGVLYASGTPNEAFPPPPAYASAAIRLKLPCEAFADGAAGGWGLLTREYLSPTPSVTPCLSLTLLPPISLNLSLPLWLPVTGHSIHYHDLIFPDFHRDTVFDSWRFSPQNFM